MKIKKLSNLNLFKKKSNSKTCSYLPRSLPHALMEFLRERRQLALKQAATGADATTFQTFLFELRALRGPLELPKFPSFYKLLKKLTRGEMQSLPKLQ